MIQKVSTQSCFYTAYEWASTNKTKIVLVALAALSLVGTVRLLNDPLTQPVVIEGMLKVPKLLTIVVPLAYTATLPFGLFAFGMAGGAPMDRYSRDKHMELVEGYVGSIGKVWLVWFQFMGFTSAPTN